jgi:transposase
LVRDRVAVVNRIQKVLEDANIKLASVASDVLGVSGRAMIQAIVDGQDDPNRMAELAQRRMRKKIPLLKSALQGDVRESHRFQLRALLDQIDFLDSLIGRYNARIEEVAAPFAESEQRLQRIPGVGKQVAEVIIAEVGTDMRVFPTAGHLSSWAGLCPGNNESAGKRRTGKTTKGSQWLRTILVQAAWAASHTKETVFSSVYRRWAPRLGRKRALVAVAHKMLVVVWHLLKQHVDYQERHPRPMSA